MEEEQPLAERLAKRAKKAAAADAAEPAGLDCCLRRCDRPGKKITPTHSKVHVSCGTVHPMAG